MSNQLYGGRDKYSEEVDPMRCQAEHPLMPLYLQVSAAMGVDFMKQLPNTTVANPTPAPMHETSAAVDARCVAVGVFALVPPCLAAAANCWTWQRLPRRVSFFVLSFLPRLVLSKLPLARLLVSF